MTASWHMQVDITIWVYVRNKDTQLYYKIGVAILLTQNKIKMKIWCISNVDHKDIDKKIIFPMSKNKFVNSKPSS